MSRLLLSLLLWCVASSLAHAELMAGAAKVEITPDLTKFTVPLGGYAARRDAPAKGVDTPIFARAIVLSQKETTIGIVSLDLCFLPRSIKEAVAKKLQEKQSKIQGNSLFLSATHTHTAPDPLAMHSGNQFPEIKHFTRFNPDLLAFVAERISEALLTAEAKMVPATSASLTEAVPNLNRNRRGDPTIDREMTVLRISTPQGKQIAAIVNFAAHPTLYDDNMMEFSPDYPGILTAKVESDMGGICLFLNGAEGDATTLNAKGATPKERIATYGGLVADSAKGLLARAVPDASPKLKMWTTALSLPLRKPNGWFVLAAAQLGATFDQAKALVKGMMPESSSLTFAQVGELLLMGVPCEPTGDIGVEAKAQAKKQGFRRPAIVALTNDWLSYCVTAKQYKAGNYEASMCFYGDGFGEALLLGIKMGLPQGEKP